MENRLRGAVLRDHILQPLIVQMGRLRTLEGRWLAQGHTSYPPPLCTSDLLSAFFRIGKILIYFINTKALSVYVSPEADIHWVKALTLMTVFQVPVKSGEATRSPPNSTSWLIMVHPFG